MISRLLGSFLAFILLWSVVATGASRPWPFEKSDLEPDPSVVFGELDNGVRYALMPNSEPADRVSLRLFVRAGSLQERDDQRGLAHYLEHMAFNGTENFAPGTLIEYFQNLGMSFGADTNAYTAFDRTVYQIELPDTERDSVDEALLVLRDFAGRMLIDEDEVESERGVILSEMRSRDSVRFRTAVEEFSFLLPEAIIADRFPIGTEEVLRAATRESLLDYYESWYRPERIAVIVVGDIAPDDVTPLIESHFSDFEARRPEPEEPQRGQVVARELATRFHPEPEASTTRVAVQSVQPYTPRPDTAEERISRLKRALAMRMLNRRLDVLANREEAPFTHASVAAYDLFDFFTNAAVEVHTRPEQWEEALRVIERELRRALQYGFVEGELREVRADLINSFEEAARRAPTRRSRDLAEGLVASFSGDTVFTDPDTELDLMKPALEAMTPEDSHLALLNAFPDGNRFVFVTGNLEISDAEETIAAVYRASREEAVEPPEDREAIPFGYESFGEAGAVEERVLHDDLDMHQVRFANGVRLNLKQTDFSSNEISLSVRLGGGLLELPEDRPGLALLASETFIGGGLGRHSVDELRGIFAGRNLGWSFSVGEDAFTFRGTTTPDDLEDQFALLAAYLTDPGYREESLRRAHTGIEAIYTAARHTAAGVLQDQVSRYLAGGDFRFGLPARDEVMALAMDDVRDWLERPLGNAYLEIAVVGDFADVDEVIALAARSLGALPQRDAGKPDFSARRVVEGPEGGGEKRIEFESRIPSGIAAVYWPTADRWDIARDRRLSLLARVFSDRMRVRIREEMGEAYSPYAVSNTSGTYRDYGWFYGIVGVDPDQANPVADVMVEIARDLRREGISEGEMQRALRPVLTSIRDTVRTNRYWLESVLASSQEFPERLEWARTMSEDFAGITVEELESLVDEYLDPDSALRVILLPVDASGQVLEPEEEFAPVGAQ